MDEVLAWIIKRPMVCAAISVLSLADALNCIHLGHTDWWFPAAVAFISAFGIRNTQSRDG